MKKRRKIVWIPWLVVVVLLYCGEYMMTHLMDIEVTERSVIERQKPEGYTYYYDQLDDAGKTAYEAVLYGVLQEQEEIYVGRDHTEDSLKRVMYAFNCDYPEYYWCMQYRIKITAGQEYYLIPDQNDHLMKMIEGKAADIIEEKVQKKKGGYQQVKAVYDYIIQNTSYEEGVEYDQDIRSVFILHRSVCSGYAKSFQYLCKQAGIPCTTVNGYACEDGSVKTPHSWNLVRIQDQDYWVDVTWGDSADSESTERTDYNYFLSTDVSFLKTHKIDEYMDGSTSENTLFEYPSCTDDSFNYYRKQGCYFDHYNRGKIKRYLSSCLQKDLYDGIDLKFGSRKAYRKAKKDLFRKGYFKEILMDYIPPDQEIYYECIYHEEENLLFIRVQA